MSERPILFSAPMVRAILAGTKTQTRRVVKPRRDRDIRCELAACELAGEVNDGEYRNAYCAPGDQLWVRESWAAPHDCDHLKPREIPEDTRIHYGAYDDLGGLRKRHGMFMPRWASRITLAVTAVRVERLQDISVADSIAEGIPRGGPENPDGIEQREYRALWESINGPGSWDANPWVWVVEFGRVAG